MACLVSPRWLYFFENSNATIHYYFDLDGCNLKDGCLLEGQEVTLKNKKDEIWTLQCPSILIASKWCEKLIAASNEIDSLKKNIDNGNKTIQDDSEIADFDE